MSNYDILFCYCGSNKRKYVLFIRFTRLIIVSATCNDIVYIPKYYEFSILTDNT